jgi:hypothetical protein
VGEVDGRRQSSLERSAGKILCPASYARARHGNLEVIVVKNGAMDGTAAKRFLHQRANTNVIGVIPFDCKGES